VNPSTITEYLTKEEKLERNLVYKEGLKGDFERGNFDISTLEFHYMLKNTFRCEAYEIREGELQ
jgi:hypothetical protein